MGLTVDQSKAKYMLTSGKRYSERERSITLKGKEYECCESFKYLGSLVTENNDMKEEMHERITACNRNYFSLIKIFKARSLRRNLKLTAYCTVVKPVVMYGSEMWTMTQNDEELLQRWERKILRKIFRPVNDWEFWRIINNKVRGLYNKPDIVTEIKSNRLRWLGHVDGMVESSTIKKVFKEKPGGHHIRGRPKTRWLDNLDEDLRRMREDEEPRQPAEKRSLYQQKSVIFDPALVCVLGPEGLQNN
ncbi:uncharacterized protein LOC126184213 [Schistocerca cancellata]|uniref:uncharacterized protein LOC126184213 n=1 Tax=Schistocerca cancellata TaxID=274614 RepID=UPI002118EE3A|nr:uncharacterized protein LOC126184213 [Schistocerca cancellata]